MSLKLPAARQCVDTTRTETRFRAMGNLTALPAGRRQARYARSFIFT
ncbi:MAG: hypothetical protein KAI96_00345 [Thermodesulfovibrionia bacterium]|nr:hypothetical protein [Thermodesulfovibrionia bacterium]